MRIYTLGTGSRSEAEIAKILSKYQIQVLADIRRSTRSPLPHLRRENIQTLCRDSKVEYIYLGNELGSERESGRVDDLDPALYQRGLSILKSLARTRGLLILCHEPEPERCNRRSIAAEMTSEGAEVYHLLDLEELWTPQSHSGRRHEKPSRTNKPGRSDRRIDRRRPARGGRGSDNRRSASRAKPGRKEPPLKKKTGRSKMDKVL